MHIVIAHLEKVTLYPPVINLIENLLNNKHRVSLVSYDIMSLSARIIENKNFQYTDIPQTVGSGIIKRYKRGMTRTREGRAAVEKYMENADVLWTTTDLTVRSLGDTVLKYKHIMQLMELERWYPQFKGSKLFKFPIDQYARRAWKVVVPEINRAYIQKTWWNLKAVPEVLPNKPYNMNPGDPLPEMEEALEKMKKEEKKIILYLGFIGSDRSLKEFAQAVEGCGKEYCLYVIGKVSDKSKDEFEKLLKKYSCVEYLGYYPAPKHLLFLQYAHIGLLPYNPSGNHLYISELNALYCAPNKIFEYSAYGIPMLGTDVPGLRQPFEKYNIGICKSKLDIDSIKDGILEIEKKHQIMSENCKLYYSSVNLDKIVNEILTKEE